MTRINSGIDPKRLTDEHLLAEHREIKRMVFSYLKRKTMKNGFDNLPQEFTLGKGHVLFFIDKGMFTLNRYQAIYKECVSRGFSIENYSHNWDQYKTHFKNYTSTDAEKKLLVDRISTRILESKKPCWHYNKNSITKQEAIEMLNFIK